jgi:hypothetical protein
LDLEEFASSTEKKSDRKFGPQTTVQEDVADVSGRIGDMQALNLFGVQVSREQSRDNDHYYREMTQVLGSLMQAAVNADPKGEVSDFTTRKAVSVNSPFDEEDLYSYL